MRPTTPRVTENGVGEQPTCIVGAQRLHRERACGERPPPNLSLLDFGPAGTFCFHADHDFQLCLPEALIPCSISPHHFPVMGKIYDNIVQTVGGTPLVRLNKVTEGIDATVLLKCEFFNPLSSVKDRIGKSMIETAEADGTLTKDTIIIEPTSGNTGIALAFVAAAKGYSLILTMPESMSLERRTLLAMLGADLVLTPAAKGMKGAIAMAEKLAAETPNAWVPQQFENPANPAIHRKTTAEEIWEDTDGEVDFVVAGVGTGGALMGAVNGLVSKGVRPDVIALEPAQSPLLTTGVGGPHRVEGIGVGFEPPFLDRTRCAEIRTVDEGFAMEMCRRLAFEEGLLCGVSTGLNVCAAIELAAELGRGSSVVTLACDSGLKYLDSGLFDRPV